MKRALGACVLSALLSVAYLARRAEPGAPLGAEVAYLARAVELTLAGGAPAKRDRYLAHPEGALPPCSPEVASALAALARATSARRGPGESPDALATGGVAESELERLLLALAPVGGLAACLAAYAAMRGLAPGARRSALAAAAASAVVPVLLASERAGEVVVEPWAAALVYLQARWIAGAGRGRDLSTATLGGMLAGAAGGLALLLASSAAPLVLGAGAWLGLRTTRASPERRSDAIRALCMFALVLVAVVSLPPSGETALAARVIGGARTAGWWARALAPLAAPLVGIALASRGARARAVPAAAALIGALFLLGAPLRAAAVGRTPAAHAAVASGLRWLRENSPSPGPFNHAAAAADWCVLTAPDAGAWVAYHARRPVVAASFPSMDCPPSRARAALAATDAETLGAALRELGARYVVVSPLMARAPSLAGLPAGSAFQRLAFPDPNGAGSISPALELVHAAELRITAEGLPPADGAEPNGPALSIYRASALPRPVPQASSAR